MNKQTIRDIAKISGFSTATVDRVLNGRSGVRSITRAKVLAAARSIGYLPDANPTTGRRPFSNQIDLVLPKGRNTYIRNLRDEFAAQCAAIPGLVLNLHLIESLETGALAETLLALSGKTKSVALIGPDHPLVRESIRHLAGQGARVVTLASDIDNVPRVAFMGIDNRGAGRLAGLLIGRLVPESRPKHIVLFAGSHSYRAHEEREMGCRSILSEEFPDFSIRAIAEVQDDTDMAYTTTMKILREHPTISAIYSMGAGNRGIAEAVRERGKQREIVIIGHELTRFSKQFLLDGTFDAIIDQHPRIQARDAIHLLTAETLAEIPRIRTTVFFKENLMD